MDTPLTFDDLTPQGAPLTFDDLVRKQTTPASAYYPQTLSPEDELRLEQQFSKEHPYLYGIGKGITGIVPKSLEEAKQMLKLPMPTNVEEQQKASEQLGKAWRGEYGPIEQAAAITGSALQALPLLHVAGARSPFQTKIPIPVEKPPIQPERATVEIPPADVAAMEQRAATVQRYGGISPETGEPLTFDDLIPQAEQYQQPNEPSPQVGQTIGIPESPEAAAPGEIPVGQQQAQPAEPVRVGQPAPDIALAQGGQPVVGISQARTEAELGPGSVEPGIGAEIGSGLDFGRRFINDGGDPRLPIRRALTSGLVGKNEVGIVHAELERLRWERIAAANVLEANPDNPVAQQSFAQADNAQRAWRKELQPVLTKASDTLREAYAQSVPDADPSTYQGLADLFDEHFKGQRDITPEMRTQMARAARGVKQVRDTANSALVDVENRLTRQLGGRRVMTPAELDADLRAELETKFSDCILA